MIYELAIGLHVGSLLNTGTMVQEWDCAMCSAPFRGGLHPMAQIYTTADCGPVCDSCAGRFAPALFRVLENVRSLYGHGSQLLRSAPNQAEMEENPNLFSCSNCRADICALYNDDKPRFCVCSSDGGELLCSHCEGKAHPDVLAALSALRAAKPAIVRMPQLSRTTH
jgi:hypothetical protein